MTLGVVRNLHSENLSIGPITSSMWPLCSSCNNFFAFNGWSCFGLTECLSSLNAITAVSEILINDLLDSFP